MKSKVFLFIAVLINLFQADLLAQSQKPARIEIPVKDDTEIYKVVPCDEYGLMLIFLSSDMDQNQQMLWVTALFDKNLKEIWRKTFALPKGFYLEEALYNNGHLVCFMQSRKGVEENNLRIVDTDLKNSKQTMVGHTIPEKSGMAYFAAGNNFALAGINVKNDESLLLGYHFGSGKITTINPGVSGKVSIESITIDESGTILTVLRTLGSARNRAYYLVKSTLTGSILNTVQLSKFDNNNMINTAFAKRVDAGTELIIGSYGRSSQVRKYQGTETIGVASTGFFSILLKDNQEVATHFYDFNQFNEFYKHLRRVDLGSIRSNRDRIGSSNYDFDLLAHEVTEHNGEFRFIAEVYYPEYRTVTTMVYDYYGRPYPSTYSVFEGFRYLTTFIAGFDETGKLRWNNDLEIRGVLSQTLSKRVMAWIDGDEIVLSYISEGKIVSKVINKSNTIDPLSTADIATLSPRDRIARDSNSHIAPWYGDYFVIYGYHNIKNNYIDSRKNIYVFYINKLAFY
jgi:hypothetical protein